MKLTSDEVQITALALGNSDGAGEGVVELESFPETELSLHV